MRIGSWSTVNWRRIAGICTCFALVYTAGSWSECASDVFLRVSLAPAIAFAPVNLEASIAVRESRTVRAELDCTNGYYSSSSWDWDDRPHHLKFRVTSGAICTLSVVVYDERAKVIGFRSVQATVIGRE